jgi:hypothetical protein
MRLDSIKNCYLYGLWLISLSISAGDIDSKSPPNSSKSYSLEAIYQRLDIGAIGEATNFAEPHSAPSSTMHSLNEVMEKAPVVDNAEGATLEEVMRGKKFWGLRKGHWGLQTGTSKAVDTSTSTTGANALSSDIAIHKKAWVEGTIVTGTVAIGSAIEGTALETEIPDGFYAGKTVTITDANLLIENIKSGVTIFNLLGTYTGIGGNVHDTSTEGANAMARDIALDRKAWVDGVIVTGTAEPGDNVRGETLSLEIPDGLYTGGKTATASDAGLIAPNIKNGLTIFGVTGLYTGIGGNVQDTGSADAMANELASGKKAWVKGKEIKGTVKTGQNINGTSLTRSIPNGFYQGNKTITIADANLVPSNIKSGVTIFGVIGTHMDINNAKAGINMTDKIDLGSNITSRLLKMTIPDGFYTDNRTATIHDPQLVTENIKRGITIFGVKGDQNVVNTQTANATTDDISVGKKAWVKGVEIIGTGRFNTHHAAVLATGQTTVYMSHDNGTHQTGKTALPRFKNKGNGTITDQLTGLIWLANAHCTQAKRNWTTAIADVAQLNSTGEMNGHSCGDRSQKGAHQTDWRLPNIKELQSLIDFGRSNPALAYQHPFSNLQAKHYWSSTTYAKNTNSAWSVNLMTGHININNKNRVAFIWAVR